MHQLLINRLLQYKALLPSQLETITQVARHRRIEADGFFSEAGQTAHEVGFVLKGILRVCYYDKTGRDVTRYFIDEDNFVVDLNSFTHRIPSGEYIQAVTDVELLVFNRQQLADFETTIEGWTGIVQQLTTDAFLRKINRVGTMLAEDATTRYSSFLENQPTLLNRIPLHYLASYLGVTPSSLSRIRRQLTKPHFLPNDN